MQVVWALWHRELIKFLRDRNRVVGALGQPLLFWLFLGLGFRTSFQMPGGAEGGYLAFLLPGVIAMTLLFTALFATISLVEERQSGFLQAALVAPVPRTALVLGTVLGGTTLAVGQALLLLLLLPLVGAAVTVTGVFLLVLACSFLGLMFTGMGVWLGWRMASTRGFHAVMNLVLMPLWLLSGAVFPLSGAHGVLQAVMWANPVTYGVMAIRQALAWPHPAPEAPVALPVALGIGGACAGLVLLLAVGRVRRWGA